MRVFTILLGYFLSLNLLAQDTQGNRLYRYKLDFRNIDLGRQTSYFEDHLGQIVATSIGSLIGPGQGCIDLRSFGRYQQGQWIKRESIKFLSSQRLDQNQLVEQIKLVCRSQLSTNQCDVSIKMVEMDIGNLYFSFKEMVETKEGGARVSLRRSKKLSGIPPLMSPACESGKHLDSWTNSAHTETAKSYLLEHGLSLTSLNMSYTLKSTKPIGGDLYDRDVFEFGSARVD